MKGEGVGYVIKSLTLKLPLFLKAEPPSDVVHRSRCCPSEGNDEHKGIDIEEGRGSETESKATSRLRLVVLEVQVPVMSRNVWKEQEAERSHLRLTRETETMNWKPVEAKNSQSSGDSLLPVRLHNEYHQLRPMC